MTLGLFGREVELDIGVPGGVSPGLRATAEALIQAGTALQAAGAALGDPAQIAAGAAQTAKGAALIANAKATAQPGLKITDLHIAGHVEHKMTGKPSPAKIKVWNPAPSTIYALQQEGCEIVVKIGYFTGGPPRQIFRGNVVRGGVKVEKQGPDRVITIEAQDGGDAIASAYINQSLAAQTTYKQAITTCLAVMGLTVATINLNGNEAALFPNGVTLVGPVRQKLHELCKSIACHWNVRDGAVQILPVGVPTSATAVVFSTGTGNLIGSPTPKGPGASTTSKGYPAGSIEVKALAEPSLRPGDSFVVESELINGTFVASDVTFEFDSGYEQPFYVTAIGAPPGAPFVGSGSGAVQSENPSLADVIQDHVTAKLADVHTSMPGVVLAYDALKQTATVQPTTPQITRDATTGAIVPILLPPLANVPVIFPTAASGGMTFPLADGDPGWLIFAERSMDNWKNTGAAGTTLQDPARQFSYTDAVFVPGNTSAAKVLGTDRVSATSPVAFGDPLLLGDANATSWVTLAQELLTRLNAIESAFNSHVHAFTYTPGVLAPVTTATAAGPTAGTTSLADIAATKVKAT